MNKDYIIEKIKELIFYLKLNDDNVFKIRAYENAIEKLKVLTQPLNEVIENEKLKEIDGIGDAIYNKINELYHTGKLKALEKLNEKFPKSLVELNKISGLGPSKINELYNEYDIDNISKLEKFLESGKLKKVKGFGDKTVDNIAESINFYKNNRDLFLTYNLLIIFKQFKDEYKNRFKTGNINLFGDNRRYIPTSDRIKILIENENKEELLQFLKKSSNITDIKTSENNISFLYKNYPVNAVVAFKENYYQTLHELTGSEEYIKEFKKKFDGSIKNISLKSEKEIYNTLKVNYIPPELRETEDDLHISKEELNNLVTKKDIKGMIHLHSNFSDGIETIDDIRNYLIEKNYEYMVLTDHSESSYYAGGLKEKDLLEQWKIIDKLNNKSNKFRIYKGIELDILSDGSLDYNEKLWKKFDFIIASIHSNLNMSKSKATKRILKALDNPYINMIGHISGRLLTKREGYELDYKAIFDKSADKNISIEFNCNPYRMDLDWKLFELFNQKNLKTSINTDAHKLSNFKYIDYGVKLMRKAKVPRKNILNTMSLREFENYIKNEGK